MSDESVTAPVVGFYGKMPSRGDFVQRGLPSSFVDRWDAWLQEVMARTQAELGERWMDAYLNAPIWYFVLPAGKLGEQAWAGAMIPSVDKVGRYFPLAQAVGLPPGPGPLTIRRNLQGWFEAARDSLLHALEQDQLDIDDYFRDMITRAQTLVPADAAAGGPLLSRSDTMMTLCGPAEEVFGAPGCDALLAAWTSPPSLFWQDLDEDGTVSLLMVEGLEQFGSELLADGQVS